MRHAPDHYGVLGIPRDAAAAAIKRAYRACAKRDHPDVHREPAAKARAEERFKDVASAYAVLSNPERRREYDAQQRSRASAPSSSPEPTDVIIEALGRVLTLLTRGRPRARRRVGLVQVAEALLQVVLGGEQRKGRYRPARIVTRRGRYRR